MSFGKDFDLLLPPYLVNEEKTRLKDALVQFTVDKKGKEIDYTGFYKTYDHAYFMQSDLVKEIRMSRWDEDDAVFEKVYPDAIIISNTCDISFENKHSINSKQCLFAPLIDFNEYIADLTASGYDKDKLEQFKQSVKSQLVSNLFYLPLLHKDKKEFVVFMDNLFWFPVNELYSYIDNIQENRITALSLFGYYLFILKLSYHLCRLPEQCDREIYI